MKFDLIDAKIFLSAYDHGSLSVAAEQNNVVVAAISLRMKRLEEQLGLQLFRRTGRGMKPTAAGDLFAKHARQILAETFVAEQELAAFRGDQRGEIRLISNTDMLAEHLPQALGQFLALHRECKIVIDEHTASEGVARLRDGSAHMAIVAEPADRSGLVTIPLARDRLVVIAPPQQPIAVNANGAISFGEILSHMLIAVRERASLTQFISRIGWEMGRKPLYRIHLDGFEGVARMVEAGAGIAVVPASAASRYSTFIRYQIVPIEDPRAGNMLYLCARDIEQLPTHARELFGHLERYARTMSDPTSL
jgi:DNA-binding transcriptional LysR family regulator